MSERESVATCTAFLGDRRLASGPRPEVAAAAREALDQDAAARILVFDDADARPIDLDLRGSAADVRARYAPPPRRPGRPKLGVVAREVTLLPRHWDWLAAQPGGASVALRKLVDAARREHEGRDRARAAKEAAYRFMAAMAGDRPGFEEAVRALFARQTEKLDAQMKAWPADVRDHARRLAAAALDDPAA